MMMRAGSVVLVVGGLMVGGCGQMVSSKAVAPTPTEAKQMAKAELDQKAGGREAVGGAHYNTKTIGEGEGKVYEVTASEMVK